MLALLLAGCFWLEGFGILISAVATVGVAILLAVAAKGYVISTREVIRNAPWKIVLFSLGMYLVVYRLRNSGLTGHLTALCNVLTQYGVWGGRPSAPAFLPRS